MARVGASVDVKWSNTKKINQEIQIPPTMLNRTQVKHESFIALRLAAFALLLSACAPLELQNFIVSGRVDYEGLIVDKLAFRDETERGTFFRRVLLIEGTNKDRFRVWVGEKTYSDARTGMWIKSNKSGVRLSGLNRVMKTDTPEGRTKEKK